MILNQGSSVPGGENSVMASGLITYYSIGISKSLTVTSGYQYRVTCTHYAKKSLLSTQKINNTSNTVTF